MKKVININFHSRVIPIEESAYEILQQYSESLRKYFANEEGRDEIINDIESRIAELFSERLKKGTSCITDDDVTAIIAGMGRPEDFEAADADSSINNASSSGSQQKTQQDYQKSQPYTPPPSRGRLYRNADDKILGGVCSGLANYLGIDPIIMRIAFVVLFGAMLWVYLLLWIIVPSQSLQSNITKRLFRSADDRVIGGVAGGLGAYFNMQTWIFRLIFALPFIFGLASGVFHMALWHWDYGFTPRFISGGVGSTLILTYIILWIALPIATTASEKLEMRGEKVDLNSIANTIKEDLEGFKGRAEKMGNEFKEGAKRFSGEVKSTAEEQRKNFSADINSRRNQSGGLGHVIGVIFKAFFLFVAGIIAISLFGALLGLLFGGMAVFPLKHFVLSGYTENVLAWAGLGLFLGVPLVALITWLIRRIMGAKSRNHYLGFVFGGLWVIGLICTIVLVAMFVRSFRTRDFVEEDVSISQPAKGKLYIDRESGRKGRSYFSHGWGRLNWNDDWYFYGDNYDSLLLNTVRVDIIKSKDSSYHVQRIKFSRGDSRAQAQDLAKNINFNISQQDSTLMLSPGFAISKFRNQQLLVIIEVPVGKKIEMNKNLDDFHWFTINMNNHRGWNISDDNDWNDEDENYEWSSDVEYIMTKSGLERTDRKTDDRKEDKNDDDDNGDRRDSKKATPDTNNGYRYNSNADSVREKTKTESQGTKEKTKQKKKTKEVVPTAEKRVVKTNIPGEIASPVDLLSTLYL